MCAGKGTRISRKKMGIATCDLQEKLVNYEVDQGAGRDDLVESA